uniref:DM domain-containing protein n=1 Tax=Parascaris equorum TaxID=6256 RepID=A0A914RH00_PAREQ
MNIEEILPELFGEKRVYYCQRCLNHGLEVKRKNHKADCVYRFCVCTDCQMVDRRRELNSRLMQIEEASSPHSTATENSIEATSASSEPPSSPYPHSVQARLKGHKRCCPFRDCLCAKCQVVQERQKLMADQIKLRRRQKKQKRLDAVNELDVTCTPVGFHITGCVKCTQQAFGYQQLLSFLDPTVILEPTVFSAILAACPHTI